MRDNSGIAKRGWLAVAIVLAVLIIDQLIKVWVKTHMMLHEQIEVLSWFKIVFIENNGMAYGMEIGSKLVLSIFRIVAIGFLGWYIVQQVKKQARWGYIVCLAMIMAGAAGNIFDSMFYGLIFNESYYNVAELFPSGGGYAPLLQGRVVDMFYFPIINSQWPAWIPFMGGKPFFFFSAIFNVADAAISIGAVWFIIDQLFFAEKAKKKDDLQTVSEDTAKN